MRPPLLVLACALLAAGTPAPPETTPGPRNAHGAAYDLRDRALVLVGGATADEVRGDTWRWKGGRWRRPPVTGPTPRTFPAIAFDSARGEVVLFGGNPVLFGDSTPPALLGDTWLLRGEAWSPMPVNGPSPRAEAAIAHDPRRGRTVLFGGYQRSAGTLTRLGDTWEWDGRRWAEVSRSGPSPRSGAAMAYDSRTGAVILFGGSGGPLGDTWAWDGQAWTRLPIPLSPGRFNTVMAPDPGSGRLIRFGGWDGAGRVSDTWELREEGWLRIEDGGPAPAARNHTVLVSAPDRGSLILYGGHDGDRVFADLWERRDGRWVALESSDPVQRVPNGH
jgi:hypothetical protein